MKKIVDTVTITELARLTKKSRPTVYKWLTLYENGNKSELPSAIAALFDLIVANGSKKDIYQFCETNFIDGEIEKELQEIFALLRENMDKLDLQKVKSYITEELKK